MSRDLQMVRHEHSGWPYDFFNHYWGLSEGRGKKAHITPVIDARTDGYSKVGDEYPYTAYCGQVLYDPQHVGIVRERNDRLASGDLTHVLCVRCRKAYGACGESSRD